MFNKSDHKEDVEKLSAHFKTNMGEFEIDLFHKDCPETVWNFVNLAEGRVEGSEGTPFYDGLIFHRIIDNFMIQGGCPQGMGTGGPGYQFADEFRDHLSHEGPGILSMANAGPGTNGSQFFITLVPCPHLDGNHTVFGKVIKGMDVVMAINNSETYNEWPVKEVHIEAIVLD